MAEEKKTWATEDPNIFNVGGVRIAMVKKGRAQAVQIERLNTWLKEHIAPLSDSMKVTDNPNAMGLDLLVSFMGGLTADAQFDLAKTLIGDKDIDGRGYPDNFLDENYDIAWVADGLAVASQVVSVQRLMTSFFTATG
jgi:hypothetical protein